MWMIFFQCSSDAFCLFALEVRRMLLHAKLQIL